MTFLRRFLGRGGDPQDEPVVASDPATDDPASDGDADDAEQARDLAVIKADRARLDDLARRQLRYARYAWTPPTQGGERRADDDEPNRDRA